MGYVKTTLVYGTTITEQDFERISNIIKEKPDREVSLKDDVRGYLYDMEVVFNHGYYFSNYKIGIELESEDCDIRTGQDFNYDFGVYTKEELDMMVFEMKDIFEKFGIDTSKFSLGVCVYNY